MMRGSCTYVWVNSMRERRVRGFFYPINDDGTVIDRNVFTLCAHPPRDGIFSVTLGHTIRKVSAKRQYHKESLIRTRRLSTAPPPIDPERRRTSTRDDRTNARDDDDLDADAALRVRARATDAWERRCPHRARATTDAHHGEHSRDGEAARERCARRRAMARERRVRGSRSMRTREGRARGLGRLRATRMNE